MHKHEWKPLRRGFPQLICRCGALKARHVKVGKNSITMSPLGSGDNLLRFTTSGMVLAVAGDVSVDIATGRPIAFLADTRSMGMIEQPDQNRMWTWSADPISTAIQSDGVQTIAALGTPSLIRTNTGTFINYNTAGTLCGIRTGNTFTTSVTQPQYSPFVACVIRTGSSVSDTRFWVCLNAGDPTGTALPSSTVGFRCDRSIESTWKSYTSSVSASTADTGITIAANTTYFMLWRLTTSRCDYWCSVAGGTPVLTSLTTNIPGAVTTQNFSALARRIGVPAVDIGVAKVSIMEGRRIA